MVKNPLVLVNPRAARISRDPDLVARIRQRIPAENLFLGLSSEELYPTLRDARGRGIETLVVVGGDGTLSGVLTALLRVWPHAALPALVLAGGGSRNSLARALGSRGTVEGVIGRLLDAQDGIRGLPEPTRQPLLRIRPDSGESLYGLSLLAGAPARWLEEVEAGAGRGLTGRTAESLRALGSALVRGQHAQDLAEPVQAEVDIDGERIGERGFTALAVSAIRELGLSVSPFPDEVPLLGDFQVGLTRSGAARLCLEVPLLTFGLSSQSCVELHEASFLTLRLQKPERLRVDTEPLPVTELLTVEPGPAIRILHP